MASSKKRSKKQRSCKPYPFDLRLRAVKLYLEEGYTKKLIEEELGIGNSTIGKWAKKYKQLGEEGLRPKLRPRSSSEVSAQIKSTAIKIKQDHPEYGQRRISDLLKRFFFIKASPKTVGKALSEQGLTRQPWKKPKSKKCVS